MRKIIQKIVNLFKRLFSKKKSDQSSIITTESKEFLKTEDSKSLIK